MKSALHRELESPLPVPVLSGSAASEAATQQTPAWAERCYEILHPLHQGGMGELFLADLHGPRGFRRRVVLKTLLPHLEQDPTLRKLFFREARLMARLHHPHIVQVFDMPTVKGRTYIAMEYVRGRNGHQVLKRARYDDSRLPLRVCLRIVSDVLRGLHAAHTARDDQDRALHLIHRDISPGNVLISFDGEVKVIDFGIAKFRDAPNETRPRSIRGKARYVSPEQVRGRPATFRSDIYSATVVLCDALLGRPLWHRASINETLMDIATEDRASTVDRIARARRIPDALQAILRSSLAIDPKDRPQSALELAEQLDEVGRELGPSVSDNELGLLIRTMFQDEPDTPDPAQLLPERPTHLSLVTPAAPILRDTLVDACSSVEPLPVSRAPVGEPRPLPFRPGAGSGLRLLPPVRDGGAEVRVEPLPPTARRPSTAVARASRMPPPVPMGVAARYGPRKPPVGAPMKPPSESPAKPSPGPASAKSPPSGPSGPAKPASPRSAALPVEARPPLPGTVRRPLPPVVQPAFLFGVLFGSGLTLCTSLIILLAD